MFVASVLTAILAGMVLWLALYRVTQNSERLLVLFCFVSTLPMCWVMYHYVRMPLDHVLQTQLGNSLLLTWIRSAYAPLTEEPAKLWPLLLPFVRRKLTQQNLTAFALALGGGFAMGEIFTVAGLFESKLPELAKLPWYSLSGFILERGMTFFCHAGMTATALIVLQRGYGIVTGLPAAMSLHYLANFPITLSQWGWFGSNPETSRILLGIWVVLCALIGLTILLQSSNRTERSLGARIYGEAVCPSCHTRYSRSLMLGLNFGFSLRYEPCPACKRWHWTRREPLQKSGL